MSPGVPAPFLLQASLPLPSPASWGEGELAGKGCTFLYCSHFSFVTPLGVTLDPRHQARCFGSHPGACLHWMVGLCTCTWVSPRSFYLFSIVFPSFTILTLRWVLTPTPLYSSLQHGRTCHWRVCRTTLSFRALLKTAQLPCSFEAW